MFRLDRVGLQGMSGQGIKEHISVKKKNDSLGIGQVNTPQMAFKLGLAQ